MTDNIKTFLMNKLEEGVWTGNKADLVQVTREIKILRNEDRKLTFKPEEWRTALHCTALHILTSDIGTAS